AALAEATHVLEETYSTQRIEHAFLEPEACLAKPDGDSLRIYSQTQGVHDDQNQIASVLAMDPASIHVELVTNGGAFGGKEDLSIQAQTTLAAHLLGRPVRTVLSRAESIRLHPKRHPITMQYTLGADAEGHLTAVKARMVGDTGAYASVGMKVLERAAGHSCGPYRVPNVDIEAKTVYTNNPPCGAMRGFGANQAAFAIEGLMDTLAERVGVDAYDIRERNILAPGDRFATGQKMTGSCGIRQTLEAVRDIYKKAGADGSQHVGIGCGIKNTGIGNGMDDSGRLLIKVLDGGRLEILTGYTEMGQGLFTILPQVVHEETGLAPEIMTCRTVSDPQVLCGMTTASRATALLTAAGQRAAQKLAAALENQNLEDLAGREYLGEYVCDFTTKPGAKTDEPVTHMTFSYATQVVILNSDGKLERVVAAHDVGRAINPLSCAGQIEGSLHMGLGYALSEDLPCTGGHPDSLLLRDLGILKAKDTPELDVILVEVPDEVGGYGSKGVGEIGLVPTAGAVAGALHAYDGVRRTSLPMIDAPAAKASVPKSRRV
ncbi:MAG: molybdopterin cofactor-binding domain-containing protein, partial [Acidobacteriota bacterium]